MILTRGFITVATGKDTYYRQALNLLRSFRLFHPATPFAIICDRENKYTQEFSDIVILTQPHNNYLDKFAILTQSPYDESIFIESDCLVYHSLDNMWDMLAKEYDLTSFGWNDSTLPFFTDPIYAAEKFLGSPDSLVPSFAPGYMFIRKGAVCDRIYRDTMRIIEEIRIDPLLQDDPKLICNGAIRDDPVFFIAMALNGCRCAADTFDGKCVFLPGITKIDSISLSQGKLDVYWHRQLTDCNILHFSSRRAREEGLYLQQTIVLNLLRRHCGKTVINLFESKPALYMFNIFKKITTIAKRLMKSLKKN